MKIVNCFYNTCPSRWETSRTIGYEDFGHSEILVYLDKKFRIDELILWKDGRQIDRRFKPRFLNKLRGWIYEDS